MTKQIRNIAILAHADAGKTSLTENFLYLAGVTKKPGSVDNATSVTDFLNVEKERGISVRSAHTYFNWKGCHINLIDTPGHVDFSADVERIVRITDAAVLIISAVEGIQSHTLSLWEALKKNQIPCIFFINKIDRIGADTEKLINDIRKELSSHIILLNKTENEGSNQADVISLFNAEYYDETIAECLADADESILEQYLGNQKISYTVLQTSLKKQIADCRLIPLLFGSAKNNLACDILLDAIAQLFTSPFYDVTAPLSALVYGIGYDKTMGKMAYVKVFKGKITNREVLKNASRQTESKVTQIRKSFANKYEDTAVVNAGDIAAICGLADAGVGDVLGENSGLIRSYTQIQQPLITVQVKAAKESDYPALAAALTELSVEDPTLALDWIKEERELNVKIMGWIQIEVLERILLDRFGIKASFENPTVIYKETPATSGEGFVQYWMPKPCWAIMKFLIEPAPLGSGVIYQSRVGVNSIQQKYQNEVERTIPLALKQGIKGWEVTDIKITLIEGEDHVMHSRPGDFVVATPMGIMNGLQNTGTTLLEPLNAFRITAPDDLLGAVTGDITQMRGSFNSPEMQDGKFILTGLLPVATSLDYPVKLSSRSGGKARIASHFHGYQPCTDEQGIIRDYKGISPLDTAKYILKARKALQ